MGLEKKTMVSKALAESSNFGGKKTPKFKSHPDALGLLHLPGTYHPCPEDLSPPAPNLPPPVQLQMPSQLKITPNITPDYCFPYRFHTPPFKYEASLIPLMLSLVVRPTVAPPCLNMGNLPPLKSPLLLFCLSPNYTLLPQPELYLIVGKIEGRRRRGQQDETDGWHH